MVYKITKNTGYVPIVGMYTGVKEALLKYYVGLMK
jgi:hypothetical protein